MEAEAKFEKLLSALLPSDSVEFERNLALARDELSEAAFAAAWAEGRTMTMEQALAMASKFTAHQV